MGEGGVPPISLFFEPYLLPSPTPTPPPLPARASPPIVAHQVPELQTVGGVLPDREMTELVRQEIACCGFTEVATFALVRFRKWV